MVIDLVVILSVILLVIIIVVFSDNLAQYLRTKYCLDKGEKFTLALAVLYFSGILIAIIVKVVI